MRAGRSQNSWNLEATLVFGPTYLRVPNPHDYEQSGHRGVERYSPVTHANLESVTRNFDECRFWWS
jgi:hypothetical protein